ncbi:MAG: hypothetical protein KIT84_21450 [Labilithrix sp.]|nr:hypothetical protein [Labilithrix sp.]MCW5813610.1 hypothetical protein [Labilithrix sp.]
MSSLEASITLDDVFAVVSAKRVPLAAELAGYLALEIADGTDAGSGDVDPKTVFISEEGTVALVRPKKATTTGDAEASVRQLLVRLLEASGSSTPALGQAAKRKPGNGLPALVEELEAALIPVNRAAGRRALARLSREVKRVTQGVGRNASAAPLPSKQDPPKASPPSKQDPAKHDPPKHDPPKQDPAKHEGSRSDTSAQREGRGGGGASGRSPDVEAEPSEGSQTRSQSDTSAQREGRGGGGVSGRSPDVEASDGPQTRPPQRSRSDPSAQREGRVWGGGVGGEAPDVEDQDPKHDPFAPTPVAPKPKTTSIPPPPVKSAASGPPPPPPQPQRPPGPPSALHGLEEHARAADASPAPRVRNDAVDELLGSFGVSNVAEDRQLARDLKSMAGLAPTPSAPDARTLAELADDVGRGPLPRDREREGESVDALLAMADASLPAPDVSANDALPPVNAKKKSGPPSPLFGDAPKTGAAAAGAPAVLRGNSTPPASRTDEPEPKKEKEALKRTSPAEESDPAAATQRRRSIHDAPRAPKTSMGILVFLLLLLGGATIAIYKYAPHVFVGKKPAPITPAIPVSGAPAPNAPACRLTLVVTDVPAKAEVLLRVGQAPVDVDQMPVGARLELVATAEGYAPRRAVIPAESVWDKGSDGKPRIEVPIQLDPSRPKPGTVDPWPPAEPNSDVGGSGSAGTVHVVSNVRGAEVWLLAGPGPDGRARIEQRCDGDIDILVAAPSSDKPEKDKDKTPVRKRIHVSDEQIAAAAPDTKGNKIVTVSAVTGP